MDPRTKLVTSLRPSTSADEMIRELVRFEAYVSRLNFSHCSHEGHLRNADMMRE